MPITLVHYFLETVANHNRTWVEVQCLSYKDHISRLRPRIDEAEASQSIWPTIKLAGPASLGRLLSLVWGLKPS